MDDDIKWTTEGEVDLRAQPDGRTFWNDIKIVNNTNVSAVFSTVGGTVGKYSIRNRWQQHLRTIY